MTDQLAQRRALTPAQCHALLAKASRYDGRTVGPENVEDWHDAARLQRWTNFELCMAAIVEYYSRATKPGERMWIMPGHVTEYVRTQSRQPEQFNRFELDAVPSTAEEIESHERLMVKVRALANLKKVPDSYGRQPRQRSA